VQPSLSGWKKRLEVTNLLCAVGRLEQAVEEYRQIIEQQPQSIEVRLKLEKMLQFMERVVEAIAIYESVF